MGFGDLLGKAKQMYADDQANMRAIAEKKKNIDAYTASTQPAQSTAAPATSTSPMDKINPKARYGDRPGEKRLSFGKKIGASR